MEKIEEEYKKNIEIGCCLCGCGYYIANIFESFVKSQISYDRGKISQEEYEQRLKSICKKQNLWKKVERPNNKITLQKIENTGIDVFTHIDQTMGHFLRMNFSLYLQK